MGVEYKHFIIPADPTFVPAKDVIVKVDATLNKWGLKAGEPSVFDLTKKERTLMTDPLDRLDFGQGVGIEYPDVNGSAIALVLGKSYYEEEVPDEDRYIERITFIAGLDYRIHPDCEEISVTILKAPSENNIPIEAYCEYDDILRYGLHGQAYTSSLNTSPPLTEIWARDKELLSRNQHFLGYWRAALIIDCGKDLPSMPQDVYKVTNLEFMNDLKDAMGVDLAEIGEVY